MPKYAGFFIRGLASLLSFLIDLIPFSVFLFSISSASSLSAVVNSTVQFLALFSVPYAWLSTVLQSFLVSRFGGGFGQLIAGISITHSNGKPLTFSQSLWRQTVGIFLSSIFFGAGFLAIFWNTKKQAWHDELSESIVIIKRNALLFSILTIVALLGFHIYLANSIFANVKRGPIVNEVRTLVLPITSTSTTSAVNKAETATISASPTPTPTTKPKPKPSPTPSPKPSPSPAFIQVKGENFSGRYGDPIPGVRITLRNLSSGATAVYSNPGPKWTMSGLEPGTYQFRFDRVEGFTMRHQLCYESCGAGWISTWAEGDEISAEINNKRPVLINLVYKKNN